MKLDETPLEINALDTQSEAVKSPQNSDDVNFNIDNVQVLNPNSFPNQPRPGSYNIPTTIPNVKQMLTLYSILVSYNVITKK